MSHPLPLFQENMSTINKVQSWLITSSLVPTSIHHHLPPLSIIAHQKSWWNTLIINGWLIANHGKFIIFIFMNHHQLIILEHHSGVSIMKLDSGPAGRTCPNRSKMSYLIQQPSVACPWKYGCYYHFGSTKWALMVFCFYYSLCCHHPSTSCIIAACEPAELNPSPIEFSPFISQC